LKELKYLYKFYLKYKWRLLLGVVFVALSNHFGVLIAQEIRDALNVAQSEIQNYKQAAPHLKKDMYKTLSDVLFKFGLIVIGFMIMKGVLMYLMRQTIIVTSRLIEYDMRNEIFTKLESLDSDHYKKYQTGDFMSRITEDVSKVRNYLGPGILYGLNLITLFPMTIIAMFQVNTELALYTLIPLPLLSISIYYVSSMINKKSTVIQQQLAKLSSISQEVYSGIRVVKSYGRESEFSKYFDSESEVYRKQSLSLAKINSYFHPLMILLINCSTLIVLWVGGNQVSSGTIAAGNIAEFIIYVNMLTWPMTSIGWIASVIQEAEASQLRINELLTLQTSLKNGGVHVEKLSGSLEFQDVSFTYKDTGIQALSKISFKLNPGQKLAIIGKTASGKSTIAELLLRMYDVDEGRILMDGKDIREYNIHSLRKAIGYVPQDVFLFSDTVEHNIRFGKENALKNEVEKYAEYAAVHEEIIRLPKAYETTIGERGVTLSGGQKQRLSIARALIKDPGLVIMDNSLSAVDTETEHQIQSYLNDVIETKTAIIITHRVTGLQDYDLILLMEDGKIIEAGIHDELLKMEGRYAEFVT
jgi:ATP-binding cassette subfamily B protein